MKFNCQCACGERFQKIIEKPTPQQVSVEMYNGFLTVPCKDHEGCCPKCSSDNTETWIQDRKQNCLDCGFEFPLSEKQAIELLK